MTSFLHLVEFGCTHGLYISDHLMRSSLLRSLATRAATSQWGSRFHQLTLGEAARFASLSPRRIRSLLNVTLIACWMGVVQLKSIGQGGLCAVKLPKVQSLDGQKYLIVQCNCVVQNAAASLCAAGGSWNGH